MRLVWGTAIELQNQRKGYQELLVTIEDRDDQAKAICYPELSGTVKLGDRVLLNTTAVDLGLGTGGKHFVVARGAGAEEDSGKDSVQFEDAMQPEAGHLMKLRYSPHQHNVLSVEAQESPYHAVMESRDSLEGVPVVCCGLHSQVPLVAAAIKKAMPTLTVGYVMDDAAALALNLSKVLADSVEAGLIDVTVSTGQAFGGQIEAINVHSGLLAAVHVGGCDVVITGIGPGLAGTGTPFGHGGVVQGEAVNAVASLGGVPVVCLRMSQADTRDRHLGISHHSLTALSRVALAPATIAIPHMDEGCPVRERVDEELDELPNAAGHMAFQLEESFYDEKTLRGVNVTTMGRDYFQDPLFYEAASAAGATAAMMAVMTIEEEATAAVKKAEEAAAGAVFGGCSAALDTDTGSAKLVCESTCSQAGSCPSANSCV
ncbi:MAG: DUF3866 family protein [Coriobacteriia bacterium]|nr:DUF3866 family protein [Coriobacteriia bacterium]MCL2746082.1 DUF3866 family protein [Coriobacteriia bacterium]MCL2870151.1 DUF3866 family protein [Coriobacteriia bacterium]